MATEAGIPQLIPTMKREGDATDSASQFDKTVDNTPAGEFNKLQGVLNIPPEIFEHSGETKNMQATNDIGTETMNTVNKVNVETPERERFLESPSAVHAAIDYTCRVSKISEPEEVTHEAGNETVEYGKQMQNNEQVEVAGETGTGEKKVVEESEQKPEKNNVSNEIVNLTVISEQMVKIEESNLTVEEESLREERIITRVEVVGYQHILVEDKSNGNETSDIQKHENDGTTTDANIDLESNVQVPNTRDNKETLIQMTEPMVIKLNKNVETLEEQCSQTESATEAKFTEERIGETRSKEIENKEAEKSISNMVTKAIKPSERAADEEATLKMREGECEIKPSVSLATDASTIQKAGSEAGEKIEEAISISYDEESQEMEPSMKMECMTAAEDHLEDKDNIDTSAMQKKEMPLEKVDNAEPLKEVPKIWPDDIIKERSDEVKEQIEMSDKAEENDSTSKATGKDIESPVPKESDSCVKEEETLTVNEVLPAEEASSDGNRNEEESSDTMTKDHISDREIIDASNHSQSGTSNDEGRSENLQQNEPEKEKPEASLNVSAEDFNIAAESEYAETITSVKEETPIKSHEESCEEETKGDLLNQRDANVLQIESKEKIKRMEVEVPNQNASDLHVIYGLAVEAGQDEGKVVDKVSNSEPKEIIQEAHELHTEEEKHIENAPEACQGANSTILEHASIGGVGTTELIPKAIETDIEKLQETSGLDYEEKSVIMDNRENTDQEVEKKGEACNAVRQEILTSSPDARKCVTDAEASVEVNSAVFVKDEKVEQIQVKGPPEAAPEFTGQDESISDAGKCVIDAAASVEVGSAIIIEDEKVEQNIQDESPVEAVAEITVQDERCIPEANDKRDNITNEEVLDATKIMIEKQNVEVSEGDKKVAEKSKGDNNSEHVTEDSNIGCPDRESIEQVPVNNLKDEKKQSEESTGEILENAQTAEATQSNAHATTEKFESHREILDGRMVKQGESLQSEERNLTSTETSPEEIRNEDTSSIIVVEVNVNDLELADAEDNSEKKTSNSEEDLNRISQKNKPGGKLPKSLADISDKNEALDSVDEIHGDTEERLLQNLEKAVQKEENEKETDESKDTEYKKIAAQEDLEKDAETPDASKTEESIDFEPSSEMDKMMVEDETLREESGELYEDSSDSRQNDGSEKHKIKEECGTTNSLEEPAGEEALQSSKEEEKGKTPKIEACEELEATSKTEAAETQTSDLEKKVDKSKALEEEKFEQSIQEDEAAPDLSKQGNDIGNDMENFEGCKTKAEISEEENKREHSVEESDSRGIIPESVALSLVKNIEGDKEKSKKFKEEVFESSKTLGATNSTVNETSKTTESMATIEEPVGKETLQSSKEEKEETSKIEACEELEPTSVTEAAEMQTLKLDKKVDQSKGLEEEKFEQSIQEDEAAPNMSKQGNDIDNSPLSIEQEILENSEGCKNKAEISEEENKREHNVEERDSRGVKLESIELSLVKDLESDKKKSEKSAEEIFESLETSGAADSIVHDTSTAIESTVTIEKPAGEEIIQSPKEEKEETPKKEACEELEATCISEAATKQTPELEKKVDQSKGLKEEKFEQSIQEDEAAPDMSKQSNDLDNSPLLIEQETLENSEGCKNKAEISKEENKREHSVEESDNRGIIPESVELSLDKDLEGDKKKSEKSTKEIFESLDTSGAIDSTVHETSTTIESTTTIKEPVGEEKIQSHKEEKREETLKIEACEELEATCVSETAKEQTLELENRVDQSKRLEGEKFEQTIQEDEAAPDMSKQGNDIDNSPLSIEQETLENPEGCKNKAEISEEENKREQSVEESKSRGIILESGELSPVKDIEGDKKKSEKSTEEIFESSETSGVADSIVHDTSTAIESTATIEKPVGEETIQTPKEEEKEETPKIEACEELEATCVSEAAAKQTLELEKKVDQSKGLEEEKFEQSIQEDEAAPDMSKQGNDLDNSMLLIEQETLENSKSCKNRAEISEEENKREHIVEESDSRGVIPESVELSLHKDLEGDKKKSEKSTEEIFESSETSGAIDSTVHETSTTIESTAAIEELVGEETFQRPKEEEKEETPKIEACEELEATCVSEAATKQTLELENKVDQLKGLKEEKFEQSIQEDEAAPDMSKQGNDMDNSLLLIEQETLENSEGCKNKAEISEEENKREHSVKERYNRGIIPESVELNLVKDLEGDKKKSEKSTEEIFESSETSGATDSIVPEISIGIESTITIEEPVRVETLQSPQEEEKEETPKIEAYEEIAATCVTEAAKKHTVELKKKVDQLKELEEEKFEQSIQADDAAPDMSKQGNVIDNSPLSIEQETLENSEGCKNKAEFSKEENNREHSVEESDSIGIIPESIKLSLVKDLEGDKKKSEKSTEEIFESSETSGVADSIVHETSTAVESTVDILNASLVKQGDSLQNEEKHLTAMEPLAQEKRNVDRGIAMVAEQKSNGSELLTAADGIENKPPVDETDLQHTAQENEPEEKHEQLLSTISVEIGALSLVTDEVPSVMEAGTSQNLDEAPKKEENDEEKEKNDPKVDKIDMENPEVVAEKSDASKRSDSNSIVLELNSEKDKLLVQDEIKNEESEELHEDSRNVGKFDTKKRNILEERSTPDTLPEPIEEKAPQSFEEEGKEEESIKAEAELETTNVDDDADKQITKKEKTVEQFRELEIERVEHSSLEYDMAPKTSKHEEFEIAQTATEDEDAGKQDQEKGGAAEGFEVTTKGTDKDSLVKENKKAENEKQAFEPVASSTSIETEETVQHTKQGPVSSLIEEETAKESSKEDESEPLKSKEEVDDPNFFIEKTAATSSTEESVSETLKDNDESNVNSNPLDITRESEAETPHKEKDGFQIEESAAWSHASNEKTEEEIKEKADNTNIVSDSVPITVGREEKGLEETDPEDKKPLDSFAPAFEERDVAATETEKTMLESVDINEKSGGTTNMDKRRDDEILLVAVRDKEIDGGLIEESVVVSHTSSKEAEEEIRRKKETTIDDSDSASVTEVTQEKGSQDTEPEDRMQVGNYPPNSEEKDIAEESVDNNVKPEYMTDLGEKRDNETPITEKARETNRGPIEESVIVSHTSNNEAVEEIKEKEETTINDFGSASITAVTGGKNLQETEPVDKKHVDSFVTALEEKDKAEIETNKTTLESLDLNMKLEEALNLGEDKELPIVADKTAEANGSLMEKSAIVSHTSNKETEEEIKVKEETAVNDSDSVSIMMVTEEKVSQETEPEEREQVDSFAPGLEEKDKSEETTNLVEKRENDIPTVADDARENIDCEIQNEVLHAGSKDQIEVNTNNVESSNLELQMEKTEDEKPSCEPLKTSETSRICADSEKPILDGEISHSNLKEVVAVENTEIEQKGEAHSQRHEDTENKDIGILIEEKLECGSVAVSENQTNEIVPESDKSQIEESSSNKQNQEDDKEIKEKEELQLEVEEHKEQDANETTKAVNLTKKEPEGVEQSKDSGDIKEPVVEDESDINELHPSSTMENSTLVCSEYNEAANLKEETKAENAEIGEDSVEETEAFLARESDEGKVQDIVIEPPIKESQEKLAEAVEDSHNDYNKIHDEALTAKTDCSEEAGLGDKFAKNFQIENSQQGKGVEGLKLEETSELASKLPLNDYGHAESENITTKNRDAGELEETKMFEAVFESNGQDAEEAEVGESQMVGNPTQASVNNDDHARTENVAVETSGVYEVHSQRHEDTNNKYNGILTEGQIEESNNYNQNQEGYMRIKEKEKLLLEAEEHKEPNVNETTKAVILTEKEQEGVEQSNDGEDIKQLVLDEECSISELHVSSNVPAIIDEMENSAAVCREYNDAADLKEEIKTENAETEEDSAKGTEASLERESEEQKAHDMSIEPDFKEFPQETVEIVEESQDKCNKVDDATLTTKTDTSLGEAEQGHKLVKDFHIEATETECSQQDKEVDNMILEEMSYLASELPLDNKKGHAESESIVAENRDVGTPEETKIAYEAVLEAKGQCEENSEVGESQTVEKPDQVPTDKDDHAQRENAAMENSGAHEVEGAKIVSIAVDESKDQGAGDNAETGKSPTLEKEEQILTSDSEHTQKGCPAVENPKVDELYEIKAVPDAFYQSKDEGTEESDGKSSAVEKLDHVPATNSEHSEKERVIVENTDAEEVEEIKIVSDAAYTSKDQSNQNIDEIEDSSAKNVDADKTEQACKEVFGFRAQGIEPVMENQITADQSPSTDVQLPNPTSILPSKHETVNTIEKIEEEKPQEVENLDDENLKKERAIVENLDAEEVEESKLASNVSYESKDQDTENIDETGQTPTREKPDADRIEESNAASDYRVQGSNTEDEITKVNAFTLPSENETTAAVEKIEEKIPKVKKLEDEVLEDSSIAKPTEEMDLQTGSREPEASTMDFTINKDICDSPTEAYNKEGKMPDGPLLLEPRENEDQATNADSSSQHKANEDLTEPTAKSHNLQFETSEKALQYESVIHNHEEPTKSEDADIKEGLLMEVISDVKPEENQWKNKSEANEITENEASKEEITEEKEVAKTHPPISLGEATMRKGLVEAALKDEECRGDKTKNVFKTTVNEIQFEELAVETEKATTSTAIREEVAAEVRRVVDSDQESVEKKNTKEIFPHEFEVNNVQESNLESSRAEATTPRDKGSSMDISQKESDKPGELIQETQELKESSCTSTEKLILTEADLLQQPDTVTQTDIEYVPSMLHKEIKETIQKAEEGDLKPGNAEGVLSEAKVDHGGEQSRDCSGSGEEKTKESLLIDSAKPSLSNLFQRSRKETLEVAGHVSKETEAKASTEEDQSEKPVAIQVKEAKLHKEKEEEEGDEHKTASSSDAPVMVEASKDVDVKAAPKKSHNILSSVGSKVKHSISKVKKAITGKSSHSKPVSPK